MQTINGPDTVASRARFTRHSQPCLLTSAQTETASNRVGVACFDSEYRNAIAHVRNMHAPLDIGPHSAQEGELRECVLFL